MILKTATCISLLVTAVVLCLVSLEETALAQSVNSNCKQAKGRWLDVFPGTGNTSFGNITNAGILDGTTQTVYAPAYVVTPAPTVLSYTANMSISTVNGQLKTTNVYLYDFATGLFTIFARVDPANSTGKFAGATGALFIGGKTIGNGSTYDAEIAGEICMA
jgi:hypothetical protein